MRTTFAVTVLDHGRKRLGELGIEVHEGQVLWTVAGIGFMIPADVEEDVLEAHRAARVKAHRSMGEGLGPS